MPVPSGKVARVPDMTDMWELDITRTTNAIPGQVCRRRMHDARHHPRREPERSPWYGWPTRATRRQCDHGGQRQPDPTVQRKHLCRSSRGTPRCRRHRGPRGRPSQHRRERNSGPNACGPNAGETQRFGTSVRHGWSGSGHRWPTTTSTTRRPIVIWAELSQTVKRIQCSAWLLARLDQRQLSRFPVTAH